MSLLPSQSLSHCPHCQRMLRVCSTALCPLLFLQPTSPAFPHTHPFSLAHSAPLPLSTPSTFLSISVLSTTSHPPCHCPRPPPDPQQGQGQPEHEQDESCHSRAQLQAQPVAGDWAGLRPLWGHRECCSTWWRGAQELWSNADTHQQCDHASSCLLPLGPVWALGRLSRQWWQQSPAPPATLPSGDTSCPPACALPTPGAL